MDPGRWAAVEALAWRLIQLPEMERERALERARHTDPILAAEAGALVTEWTTDPDFLDAPIGPVGDLSDAMIAPQVPERWIGPFRVVRPLGTGGMGEVFLAVEETEDLRRHVALKLLRPHLERPDLIERFREERRILARLDHPAIARLYQVGTTDEGRPYLVMEYVDGTPITEYAQAAELGPRDRIRLFQKVCRAVQHAHNRLIAHRDLKPGNVLVTTEGEPKLLDFGIAGAIGDDADPTGLSPRAATPAYAAPEQLRGEAAGTLSDVYSLGVLLQELVTGRRPPSGDAAGDLPGPPRPSSLHRDLPVDFDAVVRKATDADPDARYWTPSLLAADLDRALEGHAVLAREPTTRYVVSRFVARNRIRVGAAAVLVLLLASFAVVTAVQAERIRDEAARVTRERDEAMEVRSFLLESFGTTGADVQGDAVTARQLLDGRAARLVEEYADDPALLAEMSLVLAEAYEKVGLYDRAEPLARSGVQLRRETGESRELPSALTTLGWTLHQAGRLDEAGRTLAEAVAVAREVLPADHDITARALNDLGVNLEARGDYAAAEVAYLESLEMRRRLAGDDDTARGTTASNLAVVRYRLGDLVGAVDMARDAHSTFVRALGPDHQRSMTVENNLAAIQSAAGDQEAARTTYRDILERRRRLLGDRHPNTAHSMTALAIVLAPGSGDKEAESLLREALDIQVSDLGPDHPEVAYTSRRLAIVLNRTGRPDDASLLFSEALRIQQATLGPDHPEVGDTYALLGSSMASAGDLEQALAAYRNAMRVQTAALGADHPTAARTGVATAAVLIDMGRSEGARNVLAPAWDVLVARHDPAHLYLQEARVEFVRLYIQEGAPTRADSVLAEVERLLSPDQRDARVGRAARSLRAELSNGG
jgi:serine/threonine-protein kinase